MTMPMKLKEMQKAVIDNRRHRSFPSATDLSKTTLGLKEEVKEWEEARTREEQIDALGDIMIHCLGGFEILRADAQESLERIIKQNKTRTHKKVL